MTAYDGDCQMLEHDLETSVPTRKQLYRIRRPVTSRKRVTHHRRTFFIGVRHRRPKIWNW